MPQTDWRVVAEALKKSAGSADRSQQNLAAQLGVELKRGTPALVAAQMLRDALAGPLRFDEPREPSFGQAEYLADLCERVPRRVPVSAATDGLASAWIEVIKAKLAERALRALKPAPGDVVWRAGESDKPGVVVSISYDGRINISGSGGKGIAAERAEIVARAAENSAEAKASRRTAATVKARRARIGMGPPSAPQVAMLDPYRVTSTVGDAELDLLEEAVQTANDERPLQTLIEQYPQILSQTFGPTSHGAFVRHRVRLGGQLVADFMIAHADSAGVHWTLVELESPTKQISLNQGNLAGKAREAVRQIDEWREWLQNNLDIARRPPEQDGLGLVDIRPECAGLVLIGRRDSLTPRSNQVRARLRESSDIVMHSYDWLIEALTTTQHGPHGPLLRNEWQDLF